MSQSSCGHSGCGGCGKGGNDLLPLLLLALAAAFAFSDGMLTIMIGGNRRRKRSIKAKVGGRWMGLMLALDSMYEGMCMAVLSWAYKLLMSF